MAARQLFGCEGNPPQRDVIAVVLGEPRRASPPPT